MYPKMVEAASKALAIRDSALVKFRAEGGNRTHPDDLKAFYQQNRNNPQALTEWAAKNVGPQRAAEEAARFARSMEQELSNGD